MQNINCFFLTCTDEYINMYAYPTDVGLVNVTGNFYGLFFKDSSLPDCRSVKKSNSFLCNPHLPWFSCKKKRLNVAISTQAVQILSVP